jgi:hypothetical protein
VKLSNQRISQKYCTRSLSSPRSGLSGNTTIPAIIKSRCAKSPGSMMSSPSRSRGRTCLTRMSRISFTMKKPSSSTCTKSMVMRRESMASPFSNTTFSLSGRTPSMSRVASGNLISKPQLLSSKNCGKSSSFKLLPASSLRLTSCSVSDSSTKLLQARKVSSVLRSGRSLIKTQRPKL